METQGRIVIAGGTGFLGLNLARYLTGQNYEVTILGRHQPQTQGDWRYVNWDARSLGSWVSELKQAAALVNLAGRTVDCIKTPDHCDEILRSRVEATNILGKAVRQLPWLLPVSQRMSPRPAIRDWCRFGNWPLAKMGKPCIKARSPGM